MIKVRQIKAEDAEKYIKLYSKLDEETNFRLYEPGERKISLTEQAAEIENMINEGNSAIIVAEDRDELVGYLSAFGRSQNRVKHIVTIGIAILQSHVGMGIGTMLFKELEVWAKEHNKHRLELTVMENNPSAYALYQKMGFEVEGVKKDSLLINGEYVNDIYMSKLI
jgi:RimJ/RimL family protein N-acetyltransferase